MKPTISKCERCGYDFEGKGICADCKRKEKQNHQEANYWHTHKVSVDYIPDNQPHVGKDGKVIVYIEE